MNKEPEKLAKEAHKATKFPLTATREEIKIAMFKAGHASRDEEVKELIGALKEIVKEEDNTLEWADTHSVLMQEPKWYKKVKALLAKYK